MKCITVDAENEEGFKIAVIQGKVEQLKDPVKKFSF